MRIGGVNNMKKYKIAVAGTGYVGLSIATLLSQHHHETAVDIMGLSLTSETAVEYTI